MPLDDRSGRNPKGHCSRRFRRPSRTFSVTLDSITSSRESLTEDVPKGQTDVHTNKRVKVDHCQDPSCSTSTPPKVDSSPVQPLTTNRSTAVREENEKDIFLDPEEDTEEYSDQTLCSRDSTDSQICANKRSRSYRAEEYFSDSTTSFRTNPSSSSLVSQISSEAELQSLPSINTDLGTTGQYYRSFSSPFHSLSSVNAEEIRRPIPCATFHSCEDIVHRQFSPDHPVYYSYDALAEVTDGIRLDCNQIGADTLTGAQISEASIADRSRIALSNPQTTSVQYNPSLTLAVTLTTSCDLGTLGGRQFHSNKLETSTGSENTCAPTESVQVNSSNSKHSGTEGEGTSVSEACLDINEVNNNITRPASRKNKNLTQTVTGFDSDEQDTEGESPGVSVGAISLSRSTTGAETATPSTAKPRTANKSLVGADVEHESPTQSDEPILTSGEIEYCNQADNAQRGVDSTKPSQVSAQLENPTSSEIICVTTENREVISHQGLAESHCHTCLGEESPPQINFQKEQTTGSSAGHGILSQGSVESIESTKPGEQVESISYRDIVVESINAYTEEIIESRDQSNTSEDAIQSIVNTEEFADRSATQDTATHITGGSRPSEQRIVNTEVPAQTFNIVGGDADNQIGGWAKLLTTNSPQESIDVENPGQTIEGGDTPTATEAHIGGGEDINTLVQSILQARAVADTHSSTTARPQTNEPVLGPTKSSAEADTTRSIEEEDSTTEHIPSTRSSEETDPITGSTSEVELELQAEPEVEDSTTELIPPTHSTEETDPITESTSEVELKLQTVPEVEDSTTELVPPILSTEGTCPITESTSEVELKLQAEPEVEQPTQTRVPDCLETNTPAEQSYQSIEKDSSSIHSTRQSGDPNCGITEVGHTSEPSLQVEAQSKSKSKTDDPTQSNINIEAVTALPSQEKAPSIESLDSIELDFGVEDPTGADEMVKTPPDLPSGTNSPISSTEVSSFHESEILTETSSEENSGVSVPIHDNPSNEDPAQNSAKVEDLTNQTTASSSGGRPTCSTQTVVSNSPAQSCAEVNASNQKHFEVEPTISGEVPTSNSYYLEGEASTQTRMDSPETTEFKTPPEVSEEARSSTHVVSDAPTQVGSQVIYASHGFVDEFRQRGIEANAQAKSEVATQTSERCTATIGTTMESKDFIYIEDKDSIQSSTESSDHTEVNFEITDSIVSVQGDDKTSKNSQTTVQDGYGASGSGETNDSNQNNIEPMQSSGDPNQSSSYTKGRASNNNMLGNELIENESVSVAANSGVQPKISSRRQLFSDEVHHPREFSESVGMLTEQGKPSESKVNEKLPGASKVVQSSPEVQSPRKFSISHDTTLDFVLDDDEMLSDEQLHHFAIAGRFLGRLYEKDKLTDVVLLVRQHTFSAHSVILAAHSPYFSRILLRENARHHRITLPLQVFPCAFKIILDYIYTGDAALSEEDAAAVYSASLHLEVVGIKERCRDFILQHPNMLLMSTSCEDHGLDDLADLLRKEAAVHFTDMVASYDFLTLSLEQVVRLLSRDDLYVDSEFQVAEAAMRWMHHDFSERSPSFMRLIQCVRMRFLTQRQLLKVSLMADCIMADPDASLFLYRANWLKTCAQEGITCANTEEKVETPRLSPKKAKKCEEEAQAMDNQRSEVKDDQAGSYRADDTGLGSSLLDASSTSERAKYRGSISKQEDWTSRQDVRPSTSSQAARRYSNGYDNSEVIDRHREDRMREENKTDDLRSGEVGDDLGNISRTRMEGENLGNWDILARRSQEEMAAFSMSAEREVRRQSSHDESPFADSFVSDRRESRTHAITNTFSSEQFPVRDADRRGSNLTPSAAHCGPVGGLTGLRASTEEVGTENTSQAGPLDASSSVASRHSSDYDTYFCHRRFSGNSVDDNGHRSAYNQETYGAFGAATCDDEINDTEIATGVENKDSYDRVLGEMVDSLCLGDYSAVLDPTSLDGMTPNEQSTRNRNTRYAVAYNEHEPGSYAAPITISSNELITLENDERACRAPTRGASVHRDDGHKRRGSKKDSSSNLENSDIILKAGLHGAIPSETHQSHHDSNTQPRQRRFSSREFSTRTDSNSDDPELAQPEGRVSVSDQTKGRGKRTPSRRTLEEGGTLGSRVAGYPVEIKKMNQSRSRQGRQEYRSEVNHPGEHAVKIDITKGDRSRSLESRESGRMELVRGKCLYRESHTREETSKEYFIPDESSQQDESEDNKEEKVEEKIMMTEVVEEIPPRPPCLLVIGGYNPEEDSSSSGSEVLSLESAQDGWVVHVESVPQKRAHHEIVQLGNSICVIGGSNPLEDARATATASCYYWEIGADSSKWHQMAHLNTARSHHCACMVDRKIVVFGGQNATSRALSSVECYEPEMYRWSYRRPMAAGLFGAASVSVHHQMVLLFGGCQLAEDGQSVTLLDTVSLYNPHNDTWSVETPMPSTRCYASAITCSERVFICGGLTFTPTATHPVCSSIGAIDEYNIETGTWCQFTTLEVPRHHLAAAAIGDRLYIVGGLSTSIDGAVASVECFNMADEVWEMGAPELPRALIGTRCLAVL